MRLIIGVLAAAMLAGCGSTKTVVQKEAVMIYPDLPDMKAPEGFEWNNFTFDDPKHPDVVVGLTQENLNALRGNLGVQAEKEKAWGMRIDEVNKQRREWREKNAEANSNGN